MYCYYKSNGIDNISYTCIATIRAMVLIALVIHTQILCNFKVKTNAHPQRDLHHASVLFRQCLLFLLKGVV